MSSLFRIVANIFVAICAADIFLISIALFFTTKGDSFAYDYLSITYSPMLIAAISNIFLFSLLGAGIVIFSVRKMTIAGIIFEFIFLLTLVFSLKLSWHAIDFDPTESEIESFFREPVSAWPMGQLSWAELITLMIFPLFFSSIKTAYLLRSRR